MASEEDQIVSVEPASVMRSPFPERPRLSWPGGAGVAVCLIVSLEHLDWHVSRTDFVPRSARYGGPYPAVFDALPPTLREYGNRVGVFRVMDVLERLGIPGATAMDSLLARDNSYLVDQCLRRDWEIVAHGMSAATAISSHMSKAEEHDYIGTTLRVLTEATGVRPRGWLGVDYAESHRTVELLAANGLRYVCDWPNDEQPYSMSTPSGAITSLPVCISLDAVFSHRWRGIPIRRWSQLVEDTFDGLESSARREGTGRLLLLNIHPYLLGQPHRVLHLESALAHIAASDSAWFARPSDIINWIEG